MVEYREVALYLLNAVNFDCAHFSASCRSSVQLSYSANSSEASSRDGGFKVKVSQQSIFDDFRASDGK